MTTEVVSASDMLAIRTFPISRQQYTLRVVNEALVDSKDEHLRQEVARAFLLGEQARSLELVFRARPSTEYGDEARQLRIELNRALGALNRFLTTTVESFGANSPQGSSAQRLIERLFPRGIRYVIQLPFVAQESTVRLMLGWTTSEASVVGALRAVHAEPLVKRVAEVHARFAGALPKAKLPTYADVRQARREGHERMCAIVFLITAEILRGEREGTPTVALGEALKEVLSQNAAIGRYYKRRQGVGDVDPETGEELEETVEEEIDEEDGESTSPFTSDDVAKASERVIEAIENLGERVAEPWSPGEEDAMESDVA